MFTDCLEVLVASILDYNGILSNVCVAIDGTISICDLP